MLTELVCMLGLFISIACLIDATRSSVPEACIPWAMYAVFFAAMLLGVGR